MNCGAVDPETFFDRARTGEAKALCATCPIREACLSGALDREEQFGVWGGLTLSERIPLLGDRAARARARATIAASAVPQPSIQELRSQGMSITEVMVRLNVSRSTVMRAQRAAKEMAA